MRSFHHVAEDILSDFILLPAAIFAPHPTLHSLMLQLLSTTQPALSTVFCIVQLLRDEKRKRLVEVVRGEKGSKRINVKCSGN
jgi:hypothetical protein